MKEKPPRHYRGGFTNSNQKRIIHSAATYAKPNRRESGEFVAVEVHHLVPGRHEILHKLLLRVRARIDFCKGPELGVRTEDQVNTGAGPLDRLRLAVAPLVLVIGASRLPLRAHVEEVDEEVVGQRFWLLREDAVLRRAGIGAEHAQAAYKYRHLGCCQRH